MDADTLTLQKLFQKDVRYLIPSFQRPYVWEQDEQWEPLWDDVRNTAERYREERVVANSGSDAKAVERTPAHFLGAVVLQQEPSDSAEFEKRLVIDGQQRLTTLQLLLDATQEVFEDMGLPPSKRLSKFVRNDEDLIGGDEDHIFKVWPTLTDRDAFRYAMHNHLPSDQYEESRIVQAHDFFKLQVREWLKGDSAPEEELADALLAAISRLLQLVVIDLDAHDNPHIIFETLNARGTPLLQADLVKNYILSEAGGEADDLHTKYLRELESAWWREDVRQGRLVRPRVDVFLNYWLAMKLAEEVQAANVFSVFRKYASSRHVAEIAADIRRLAETYYTIESTDDGSVFGRFRYRWDVMQVGALTPVLMWLLSSGVPEPRLERCLRILDSFLTRRMACRMTTNGYTNLFLALLRHLNEKGPDRADDALLEFLASQTAWANLWPTDHALEEQFVTSPLYRLLTRGRLRLVLEGIEEQLRSPKAESEHAPRGLTIEHVMPQGWRKRWEHPCDEGEAAEAAEAAERRDRLIHSIGNLTFVNQKLNSSLSNAPWQEKQPELDKHSTLFLNKELLENADAVWDEAAIEARARRLARVAAEVWPHADSI